MIFFTGALSGYRRILVVDTEYDTIEIFATNDEETYIAISQNLEDIRESLSEKGKTHLIFLSAEDRKLFQFPEIIKREKITFEKVIGPSMKREEQKKSYMPLNEIIVSGFSVYQKKSDEPGLSVSDRAIGSEYIQGAVGSDVALVDPTGLMQEYKIQRGNIGENFIQEQGGYVSEQIYQSYGATFKNSCSIDSYLIINQKKITNNDLRVIGSRQGYDIMTLKDKNHPFLKELFEKKSQQPRSINPFPDYESYIARHPLLFFYDIFGRLLVTQEMELGYFGPGCGKPVLYFYPKKETKIKIKFLHPIDFTVDIPTYHDGWFISANPQGEITDLQPHYTSCTDNPQFSVIGAEYAKSACEKNTYPYIYRAGYVLQPGSYPSIQNKGSVIPKNTVEKFLSDVLDHMQFLPNEKKDFLEYRVPQIQKKSGNYVRITFFDTAMMNSFIPIDISPKPDTLYRIFLDWETFSKKPQKNYIPQTFVPIERKGFTVVEWGGLKR